MNRKIFSKLPRPPVPDLACFPANHTTHLRNPLTIAFSANGLALTRAFALFNSTAPKRSCGVSKCFGPSYPQALAAPVGAGLVDLWAVYSVNKEDVGLTHCRLDLARVFG